MYFNENIKGKKNVPNLNNHHGHARQPLPTLTRDCASVEPHRAAHVAVILRLQLKS